MSYFPEKNHSRSQKSLNRIKLILRTLKDSNFGMTPTQIAKQLNIPRATINKYLAQLHKEGKVEKHKVGHYTLYAALKRGGSSLFQTLYYGTITRLDYKTLNSTPTQYQALWGTLARQMLLPFEEDFAPLRGPPTSDYLERLIEVVTNSLGEFGYYTEYPIIEILPSFDAQSSMTRLIRVKDPGLITQGAMSHYYLIAALLERKLSQIAGIPVIFRVINEIQSNDKEVYFEIGFVDRYFIDMCIVEQKNSDKTPRDYLEIIQKNFMEFIRMKLSEYRKGDKLHFEMKAENNQEFEEFFTIRSKILRQNQDLFQKYNLKSSRPYLPYEDWPDEPYLVVQLVTNIGFAFDEYYRAVREIYPKIGYRMHFEKILNGWKINFQEEFDFNTLFVNQIDDKSIREHYKTLDITNEDYLAERKLALIAIFQSLHKIHNRCIEKKVESRFTALPLLNSPDVGDLISD